MLMLDAPSAPGTPPPTVEKPQQARSNTPSPNEALKRLVDASGLTQAVAMTIFNRELGAQSCSETEWRGFLAEPDSLRYRELSPEQLRHALAQFSRIGVHQEQN